MYALLFASNFRLDHINKHRWEDEIKKRTTDEVFNKFNQPYQNYIENGEGTRTPTHLYLKEEKEAKNP